ncbi:MAG: hypothetical protein IIC39_05685 [Candidatus Marinimicrobia bacterium]|nr:hypothetical protein [Candidatus Neomarinimicrobiota bacterium]
MDIKGKTILVLGGWGLVGQAICRRLIPEKPGKIVITSLHKRDADSMAESDSEDLSEKIEELIRSDQWIRSTIVSIGLPILLRDGRSILR